jgi:nucleotide-binding universal stress UspA family protein
MKRLLTPCDFSNPAIEAFKFAVKLARETQSEIHVVYILDITFLRGNPTLDHSYAFNLNFLKEMEQEADEKFKKMRENYGALTLPIYFTHQIGTLVPDIEKYIREKSIDLVIMGTDGTHESASNTLKIVRNSTVPVFEIHVSSDKPIRNILVPVLPDQPHKKFIDELKNLQSQFKAKIHLLWVNTPHVIKADQEATADLQQFAKYFTLDNYSINIRSNPQVEEGISEFAKEINVDMIAMGTHGWKGFTHLIAGSVTEDTVSRSTIPVWTYSMR